MAIDSHDTLLDTVHVEDSGLGVVDQGSSKHGTEDAGVADAEVAALEIVHGELAVASLWLWELVPRTRDKESCEHLPSWPE